MQPPKLGQEIATTGDGRDITRPFLSGLQQPSDYILQRRGGNDLRIYEEVLRDAQVKATWGQRQLAVVSREWQVVIAGSTRLQPITCGSSCRTSVGIGSPTACSMACTTGMRWPR